MRADEYLNKIVSLSEIGKFPLGDNARGFQSFGIGSNSISFINENFTIYTKTINDFFQSRKLICKTFSIKEFEKNIIDTFSEKIIKKEHISREDANAFTKALDDSSVLNYSVMRKINGIHLSKPEDIVDLGPFKIFRAQNHKEKLSDIFKKSIHEKIEDLPEYIIEASVPARSSNGAQKIADEMFENFEHCIRFIMGNQSKKIEIAIHNYGGAQFQENYVFHKTLYVGGTRGIKELRESVDFSDKYFSEQHAFQKIIWENYNTENLSDLKKRIILSIDWAGQAYLEKSPSSAFLKSAIALEILFTPDKNAPMSASIQASISETVAMLCGENVDERISIEKLVKKLYGIRSSIAHAGKNEIEGQDLADIFAVTRQSIMNIICTPQLYKLDSLEKLREHFKALRYSFPPLESKF